MKNVFYFGLEPLKARYTYQLSKEWMPNAFEFRNVNFIDIEGDLYQASEQIKVGSVLDAVGRGVYTMSQCTSFLINWLETGKVKDGDAIFLQDYWHPGIESILYALDLYGIKVDIYAMLHAQSVDEYDFTYPMRSWMRGFELGLDKRMTGIFVGSTIHKEQLRQAGFEAPIHVVSLPLDKQAVLDKLPVDRFLPFVKENRVVYSSRLDKEKNPYFMLETAKLFLNAFPDWEWIVTTSGLNFKSMLPDVINDLYDYAAQEPRFRMLSNLTKEEYYMALATSKIQFNSSLQDYVSWTVLESMTMGCKPVFPNFRSFTELIDSKFTYEPFNVNKAFDVLMLATEPQNYYLGRDLPTISDLGRRMEAYIVEHGIDHEINVWHEYEYCKQLLQKDFEKKAIKI